MAVSLQGADAASNKIVHGDSVAGDKIGGDKVAGNKIIHKTKMYLVSVGKEAHPLRRLVELIVIIGLTRSVDFWLNTLIT